MGHRVLGVGITGPALTELERRMLEERPPYGVVLFGRNVVSHDQLAALVGEIKSISETPPLIMIDEEGGRVDRLRQIVPGLPGAEAFGEGDNAEELASWFGQIIGRALRHFDIDINLAPVVDLRGDVATKGLERRCFGAEPEEVIELAGRFIRAQQAAGVAACLKHFPGIGQGTADTHYGASVINVSLDTLMARDLKPFVALGNEAGSVMIGHGAYPAIDEPNLPASLSRKITTEVLRDLVGFTGAAISDDMEMHAVADLGGYEILAERALLAGNDVVLFCSHIERVPSIMEHLEQRAASDELFSRVFAAAITRAERFGDHCDALRAGAGRVASFEVLMDEVQAFTEAFEEARRDGSDGMAQERRQTPRTKGTGKLGREEWT